jgi:small-conductance mechanosensitive channel
MSEALALSSLSSRMKNTARSLHTGAYLFLFTYFLADLYGFSQLAIYAFSALAKTFLVLMWSGLFLKILIEFKSTIHFEAEKNKNDLGTTTLNRNWFFTLVSALIWLLLSLLGLIYIWGGKHAVIQGAYAFYVTPVTVGTMQFSLKKVCVAVLMLMITHIAAKVWRDLFQKKLLSDSGMDIGVQESVTTISVYLIWTVGILMALNVFGLNMTSITVVLGALGIGIGFGLQNIFNNFLSGIILLFERPIQVGDDVEVNGTWANVKKINVRSTVVQTYDNATLIIPNSDFISTQVTNWSFKDKRIRRNITVGVAYGSDTGLVHSSLLEAADKTMRVLKYPNPDVVFKDFGDNSLVFILRFWTRVEYFYAVESDVRFEIDRLFRERGIEISFPQRDIHIRSFDQAAVVRHTQIDNSPKQISGEDHSPKEIVSEKE